MRLPGDACPPPYEKLAIAESAIPDANAFPPPLPPHLGPVLSNWRIVHFDGDSTEKIDRWLEDIEWECVSWGLDKADWVYFGLRSLGEKPLLGLARLHSLLGKQFRGAYTWDWENFALAMRSELWKDHLADEKPEAFLERLKRVVRENPGATAGAGILLAGAAIFATPLVLSAGLGAAGFSSTGVDGSTLATSLQSSMYRGAVASGSAFAACQSFAAGGMAVAVTATQRAGAAVAATAAAVTKYFGRRKANDDSKSDDH